ncbi:MAG: isopentenyl transferase family protein, partial [Gemmatimonadota bacterium]
MLEPAVAPARERPVVAILGPTASGKTELGLALAGELGGEIVSVDSRQAYRGMEVGTAAPTPEQRAEVPHHGVAFLAPGERYGAGRFARLARGWIDGIRDRGREPLLVGGTGLFFAALLRPVFREPPLDPA